MISGLQQHVSLIQTLISPFFNIALILVVYKGSELCNGRAVIWYVEHSNILCSFESCTKTKKGTKIPKFSCFVFLT